MATQVAQILQIRKVGLPPRVECHADSQKMNKFLNLRVRKVGLPPPGLNGFNERGQAALPYLQITASSLLQFKVGFWEVKRALD